VCREEPKWRGKLTALSWASAGGPELARRSVVLDFNLAYNPPCAWTPYATCPLPTRDNRLEIAVEAGEKAPH